MAEECETAWFTLAGEHLTAAVKIDRAALSKSYGCFSDTGRGNPRFNPVGTHGQDDPRRRNICRCDN